MKNIEHRLSVEFYLNIKNVLSSYAKISYSQRSHFLRHRPSSRYCCYGDCAASSKLI